MKTFFYQFALASVISLHFSLGVFALSMPQNINQDEMPAPESQIARYFEQAFQKCSGDAIFTWYDSGSTHLIKCRTHQSIKDELDLGTYPASCADGQTAYGVTGDNRFLLCKKARTNACGITESEAIQLNTTFTNTYRGRYYTLTAEQWCEKTILQADSQWIAFVPSALSKLKKLTLLDLSYNQITSLPLLGKMGNLQTLNIHNNLLTSLPSDIGNLTKLNPVLNLSNNRLTSLPESIGDLTQITSLDISMNNTQSYASWDYRLNCAPYGTLALLPDTIVNLVNLTSFSAYCSGLELLPTDFGNLNQITKLELYSNQLTSLPESFGNLLLLSWSLDLAYNKLTSLPESFGNFINVNKVLLEWNQLTSLPGSFKNLRKLSYLNLNYNKIATIPWDLAGMWDEGNGWSICNYTLFWWSCEYFAFRIDLNGNKLKKIPDGFWQLKKLSHLNLSYNQINQLSDDFGDLTELVLLNLDRNELVHLPASFWWLEKLNNLNLNQNKLIDLPDNFGNLIKLATLNLSGNKLSQLPDSFVNLVWATEINLRTNELSELPANIGNIWSKLTKLILSENKISVLPDSIGNLTKLRELDVGNNKLIALPDAISNLQYIVNLNAGNNQIATLPENFGNIGNQENTCIDLWWMGTSCTGNTLIVSLEINQLKSLPESIGNMKNIQEFRLASNDIEKLPNSIGNLSGKMRLFTLNGNMKLKSLAGHWGTFGGQSQNELNMTTDGSPVKITAWWKVMIEVGLLACDLKKSEVDALNILTGENKNADEWCTGTTSINLSGKNLDGSMIPSGLTKLKNVTELDLSYNNFAWYWTIPTVTKLNLSHNKILYGSLYAAGCSWIPDEVDLSYNLLTEFRWWWNGSVECLLKPIKLNLSNNQIKFIQAKSGQGGSVTTGNWYTGYSTIVYSWVTYLDYSNNQITSIQESFTGYTNLQRLNLSGNPWIGDLAQDFVNGSWSVIAFQDSITPNDKTITIRTNSDASPIKITADTSFINECGITEVETQELNETIYGDSLYYGTSYKSARQLCALTTIDRIKKSVIPESFGKLKNLETLSNSYGVYYGVKISKLPESFGNLTKLRYLYLAGNQLTELPESFGNLVNLYGLGLENNQLTKLPENFGNLTNILPTLDLSGNQIRELPLSFGNLRITDLKLNFNPISDLPVSFGNLAYLKNLSIQGGGLKALPANFGMLNGLITLNLTANQIQSLPNTFVGLANLDILQLSNNQLTELPVGFSWLANLKVLNLNDNQLTTLSPDFWLAKLTQLSAKNNKLTSLPDSFTGMTSIQYIELQNNQLTSLGKFLPERSCLYGWYGGCYYISALNISLENNQLASLPENIGKMGISSISLHHNKLTTLPESFGQSMYYGTQIMDLSYNKLVTLPESFSGFTQLKTLDLTSNELARLPRDFGRLENLETLKLYTNQLAYLPENFGGLSKLKFLDLFSNKLGTLPSSFGNLTNLEELDLGANQLTSLPDVFGNIKKVRYLKLHQNQLQKLPPSITQMTQLIWVILSNNRLTELPEWLGNLTNLIDLNLRNNVTLTQLPATFDALSWRLTELDMSNTWLGELSTKYDTYSSKMKSKENSTIDGKKITISSPSMIITKE
jgi:Leucine-rich repeat (LRR) protein